MAALLPDIPEEVIGRAASVVDLEVAKIRPNPYQPRLKFDPQGIEELRRSILEKGVIQPVVVRRAEDGYELVVGERRLRAAKAAALHRIPAIISQVSTPEEMMELGLVENLQREDLNPMDEAGAYHALATQCSLTQQQIAQRVGKDRSTVANMMRLLKLPEELQDLLYNGSLTIGHARALLAVNEPRLQLALGRRIAKEQWSVRKVEELVKAGGRLAQHRRQSKPKSPLVAAAEEALRRILGTKVSIEHGRKKGRIEIEFYSDDDLERILQILSAADASAAS